MNHISHLSKHLNLKICSLNNQTKQHVHNTDFTNPIFKKSMTLSLTEVITPAGIWYPLITKFFCGILFISRPIGINLQME